MLDSEALSCRDVERLFGVPVNDARAALKQRMAHGDAEPLQVHGTWLAPLYWWREVLDTRG